MRSSLRLLNLEATPLQGSRTRYVCSVCRQEARPRPFVARQFLRNASDSSTPITERVRRKLWGTDNPPGLKDPYGGEGVFEKKFKRGQAARQEDQAVEATPAETQGATAETAAEEAVPEGSSSYEPATTWAGLQRIGHLGNWSDYPPSEADAYNSYVHSLIPLFLSSSDGLNSCGITARLEKRNANIYGAAFSPTAAPRSLNTSPWLPTKPPLNCA